MGEDSVVEVRRARLKLLIEDRYKGIQANMVRDTGINAGELSGLLKTRFFGEKKARLIERTLNLPDRWLDGADVEINTALDDFKWILENATDSEKSILLATVDAIRSAYRDSSSIEELKPLIERRKKA